LIRAAASTQPLDFFFSVNMETIAIRRWRLQSDPEATRTAFSNRPLGSPESCGCSDCQNFAAARDRAYPSEVLAIFEQLGIDSHKESQIWHYCREGSGFHHYGGFFHFVGIIESGTDAKRIVNGHVTFDLELIGDDFEFGFTSNAALVPKSFAGAQVVQLEFQTKIPWVLDIPESD
jgi:hypothetical protein